MYVELQLIAYQLPTVKLEPGELVDLEEHKATIGDLKKNNVWLPEIQNADLKKRLARLIGVIERAYAHRAAEVSDRDTVLKVFLVPEFYFRPSANQGVQRSYTKAERDALVAVLDTYVKAARFKDWFFVLGTVVWEAPINVIIKAAELPSAVVLKEDAAKNLVIKNTALVGHGGSRLTTFDKAQYSPADDISEKYWAYYNTGKASTGIDAAIELIVEDNTKVLSFQEKKAAKQEMVDAIKKYLGQGEDNKLNGLATYDGVHFGIEVCLDHHYRFLSEALAAYKKCNNKAFPLDAQILISCGMEVLPAHVRIAPGQVVLRNDGNPALSDAPRVNVEICRLLVSDGKDTPINSKRMVSGCNGDATQYNKDNSYNTKDSDLQGYLLVPPDTAYHKLSQATGLPTSDTITIAEAHPQRLLIFRPVLINGAVQNNQ